MLALAVVAAALWRLEWETLASLESVHAWLLLLTAAMLHLATLPMKAVAWRSTLAPALGDRPVPLGSVMTPVTVGALLNTVLVGRVGEAARVAMVHARLTSDGGSAQLAAVVGSAVTETLVSTAAWVMLVAGVGLLLPLPIGVWLVVVALAAMWLLVLAAAFRFRTRTGGAARGLVARAAQTVRRVWASVALGHRSLRRRDVLVPLLAASFGGWIAQGGGVYAVLRAFDIAGGWEAAALVLVSVSVAQTVPLLPGNVGVFQAAAALPLVASYGVPPATAVAVGVILQLVQSGPVALVGALTLARQGEDLGRLYAAARNLRRPLGGAG
ncbi:lysylphosphatidylglycerol synthase transmembrane domain-containing protein [Miltoncostaea marina]|uniref:lysylphosphatidylglycerol synthase transmembrane domain-containing protein n=1 Tax=Miltoncostaea marina TaxID=2843215 RepID=UPI001C3D8746|nr:lysylphosphatidylglycerol synthase transmembrane domain-containing protein [Miltoncostaea marina]